MTSFVNSYVIFGIAALGLTACAVEPPRQLDDQPLMQMQSSTLQGILMQGNVVHNMTMRGFRFAGATRNGAALSNFRLEKGELVAEQGSVTLRNTALVNTHLFAEAENKAAHTSAVIEYRIAAIIPEDAIYDPKNTGNTFLYTLEQNVDNTGNWQPACSADHEGRNATIPLADIWDDNGNRNSSAPLFTLACTNSSIGECYRWGYRPWVPGPGNLKIAHWACTRVSRADYCGDGKTHTIDGTMINIFDSLPGGPIQAHGTTPPGMTFEAAWDQTGALCLSHTRWATNTGSVIALECPNKLHPPGQGSPSVCDDVAQGMAAPGNPIRLYNESIIN